MTDIPTFRRTLKLGDESIATREMQQMLLDLNEHMPFIPAALVKNFADANFGPNTEKYLKIAQGRLGVEDDRIFGEKTYEALAAQIISYRNEKIDLYPVVTFSEHYVLPEAELVTPDVSKQVSKVMPIKNITEIDSSQQDYSLREVTLEVISSKVMVLPEEVDDIRVQLDLPSTAVSEAKRNL